jgi:mannose-6-phosphate isomerase-like protein (cupin superfamily)
MKLMEERKIRRIVTGLNQAGKSTILEDKEMLPSLTLDAWPGFSSTELWYSDETPIDLTQDHKTDHEAGFDIPSNATQFIICHTPPFSEMIGQSDLAASMNDEALKKFGYHRTNTLDYALVLSGAMTLVLDEEETILKAGDSIVQKGVDHTWRNHTDTLCIMAFIMMGAKPLL